MRNRWLIYLAVGLCFGIIDWYFLDLLASLSQIQPLNDYVFEAPEHIRILIVVIIVVLNYGIWLVPLIPTAIYEMKHSHSLRRAAISAVIVWSAAMLSYYSYYTFRLMFVGLPNVDFMLFSNRQSATYWRDWWIFFKRVVLDQFLEWIGVAVIGGAIVGTMSAYAFRFVMKKKVQRELL